MGNKAINKKSLQTNILTPTLGKYNRYNITTNQNNSTTHRLVTKTLVKHRNTNTYKQNMLKHNYKHSKLKAIKHNQDSKTRHPSSSNHIQQSLCTKKLVCMDNTITLSFSTQYRIKMAGGSKGTARNLTIDPDFIMRDTIFPPIGTKRSGGNQTTSTEKKNKLAPKEVITPPTNFWLGFDIMERLAIDEGTPLSFSPTPIHNLIESGFSEKEAK